MPSRVSFREVEMVDGVIGEQRHQRVEHGHVGVFPLAVQFTTDEGGKHRDAGVDAPGDVSDGDADPAGSPSAGP